MDYIYKILGPSVNKISEWHSDSGLNFTVCYQLGSTEITIWRDRGLYTVLLSSTQSSMTHYIGKIAEYLNKDNVVFGVVSYPKELRDQLCFIKNNTSQIEDLFLNEDIDTKLNETGKFKSIPKGTKIA